MIRARTVRLVAAKELLEAVRDRRTLFVALVLPILLYPLMMVLLLPMVGHQRQELARTAQPVALTGPGADALRALVLDAPAAQAPGEPEDEGSAEGDPQPIGLDVVPVEDAARSLREGEIALWVEAPEGLREAALGEGSAKIVVHYDGSDERSMSAQQKWIDAVAAAQERLLRERLARRGLSEDWLAPIDVGELRDVAPPEQRAANTFGRILALLLVVMTLSSSFYPAIDAVAGEKERGTMETLLVAPCARTELVLGKFVSVLVVTLAAACLNLVSMGITAGPLLDAMGDQGIGRELSGIRVTLPVAGGILLLLLPLAAVFSALSLALSTLARSVKEAQHYMTPVFVVVMPLAMVVVLPNVQLTPLLASVPITNAVLFFRDLLVGRLDWTIALLVLGSTVAAAGLAIWVSVMLFLRESTLFRGPESTGRLLRRPVPRLRPSAAGAVLLFVLLVALIWYSQGLLPQQDLVRNVLYTQFLVILAPPALAAWWFRMDARTTFRLAPPRALALLLAVPIGLAFPIVNLWLHHLAGTQLESTGPMRFLEELFLRTIQGTSPAVLVLVLAALPAFCEELAFRGFLLSGLRSGTAGRGAAVRAGLLSAAFFALFHIFPEKYASTFLMGCVLAFLALRGGSVWPGVLAHTLNNSLAILAPRFGDDSPLARLLSPAAEGDTLHALGALAVLVASLLLYARLAPRGAPRGTPEPAAPADA